MTRPVYSFRPNLKNPEHKKAWEKFQSVPEGQKNQYLVRAILEKEDRKWMEEIIQKTIKESVREYTMNSPHKDVPARPSKFYLDGILEGCLENDLPTKAVMDAVKRTRQEMKKAEKQYTR